PGGPTSSALEAKPGCRFVRFAGPILRRSLNAPARGRRPPVASFDDREDPDTRMPASDPVVQPASGIRVLVVEDQADIAANIWDFLERRGYLVDHAADGAAGLARALHGVFDVIVLDLGLPRLDGPELCRRLRDAGHGVPVLMLTARDTLDDKLRGFAEGADDYMVKPFAMRELEARIRVLHRGNLAAGADR